MARRNGVLLPIVALVLGLLAIGLSFIAYSKRIKVIIFFLIFLLVVFI